MSDWNWEKYIRPILNQINIKRGMISHRITNKKIRDRFIDDLVVTFFSDQIEYEDPMYGYMVDEEPELWFEQRYHDPLSIRSLRDLENKQFIFQPGEVFGSFSNEIDIMPLSVKFDQIKNKGIICELEMSFTNRDCSFEGTFEEHSKKSIMLKTNLEIEPLVYLDYHHLINDREALDNHLKSDLYNIEVIHKFDFGWKDDAMKSYKIELK